MVAVVFAGILPNVFATGAVGLTTSGVVELNGTDNGTVDVILVSTNADTIEGVQAVFAPSVGDGLNTYLTLSALTPGGAITPTSNVVSDGTVYWLDPTLVNGYSVAEGGAIWTATYTVDKDTPAGNYRVDLTNTEIITVNAGYDAIFTGNLSVDVEVTRNDTPATKPSQVVTFRDSSGNPITGLTQLYGDADIEITKEVTTGDGAIYDYHPDDSTSEHPGSIAHTYPTGDMIGFGEPGTVDICAWVAETETYAETKACYTVEVTKRPIEITGATITDKTYDGTTTAEVTAVTFSDLGNGTAPTYTADGTFGDADAGTDKAIRVDVTLTGDAVNHYTLSPSYHNTTKTISPFVLTPGNVELLGGSTFGYDPDGVEPQVRVTANVHGGTSTLGSDDYEVSYGSNTTRGTGHVYVTGKNNFTTGENPIDLTFTIEARGINGSNLVAPSTIMQGHILTVDELSVVVDGHTLVQCANNEDTDCDYYIAISGDNDGIVGHTVNVLVNAREGGNYSGIANAENIPIVAKQTQTVTFGGDVTNTTVNKTYGDANFTYTASSNGDGTISYGSSNESVVTVNNNGEVTIVGVGDADITATASETATYASGSAKYSVHVSKKVIELSGATVSNKMYDGTTSATATGATLSDSALVYGTDFTVTDTYFSGADAGNYDDVYVEVTLNASVTDRYEFNTTSKTTATIYASASITKFAPALASRYSAELTETSFVYSGDTIRPSALVKVDLDGDGTLETVLVAGNDYDMQYTNNINAGTSAKASVLGKGNYNFNVLGLSFTITPAPLTNVSATAPSQTYTGSALEPEVTVTATFNESTITLSANDFEVSAHGNFIMAGDHTFTVVSKDGSNYSIPSTNGTFTIDKAPSGEPAEFSEEFRIEAGKTLADLVERTVGFSWVDATTPVAVGSNNYSATYIKDNDATNYNPSNLSLPVYGLKKVNVAVTDSAVGGTSSSNSAMVLEGEDAVITFTPDDKFELASVTVNGTDRTADVSNNKLTITAGADDIAVVASYRRVYDVVEGDGQTHVKNKDGSADFEIDAPYAIFNSIVYVDGAAVSADNFEAWGLNPLAEDSSEELMSLMAADDLSHTVLRLTEAYLNTLSDGEHALAVQFTDGGIARGTFYIVDPEAKAADTGFFTREGAGATVAGISVFAVVTLAGTAFIFSKRNK